MIWYAMYAKDNIKISRILVFLFILFPLLSFLSFLSETAAQAIIAHFSGTVVIGCCFFAASFQIIPSRLICGAFSKFPANKIHTLSRYIYTIAFILVGIGYSLYLLKSLYLTICIEDTNSVLKILCSFATRPSSNDGLSNVLDIATFDLGTCGIALATCINRICIEILKTRGKKNVR